MEFIEIVFDFCSDSRDRKFAECSRNLLVVPRDSSRCSQLFVTCRQHPTPAVLCTVWRGREQVLQPLLSEGPFSGAHSSRSAQAWGRRGRQAVRDPPAGPTSVAPDSAGACGVCAHQGPAQLLSDRGVSGLEWRIGIVEPQAVAHRGLSPWVGLSLYPRSPWSGQCLGPDRHAGLLGSGARVVSGTCCGPWGCS